MVADDAGRFYATSLAEQNGAPVFISLDGGKTWTRRGDPLHGRDLPIAPGAMEINPQGPIYMGPSAIVACDREFLAADRSTKALCLVC